MSVAGAMSGAPSTLSMALQLAEEWSIPVFPCRREPETINGELYKEKSPYPIHGFKDATCNAKQIERWWERYPDAMIGVPTGLLTKLYVVDVDPRGLSWYSEHSLQMGAGRVHRTARGYHILYQYPTSPAPLVEPYPGEWRNTGSSWHDGLDTRGEGGYIIWHPAEGRDATGELSDIGPMPEWMLAELSAAKIKKAAVERKPSDGGIGEDRSKDLLKRVARDIASGLADYEIHAKHIGHPHVTAQTDKPRTIQRCIDLVRTVGNAHIEGAEAVVLDPEPINLNDFFELDIPEPQNLIGGLVREGGQGLIAAQKGVGKTFFGLALGMAAVTATPFLGYAVPKKIGVLYVDGEMAASDIKKRCKWIADGVGYKKDFAERFEIMNEDMPRGVMPKINTEAGRAWIAKYLTANPAIRLVILDNFACLIAKDPKDQYGAIAWSQVWELMKACRRINVACFVIAHHGKDNDKGIRGASEAEDHVDVSLAITPAIPDQNGGEDQKQTRVNVMFKKGRHMTAEEKQPFVAILGMEGGAMCWTRSGEALPVQDRIRQFFMLGMSPSDIKDELGCHKSFIYKIRKEMIESGEIKGRMPKGDDTNARAKKYRRASGGRDGDDD